MSYGNDRVDQYRRAAFYVDKILRGTKPATSRSDRQSLKLIINLKDSQADWSDNAAERAGAAQKVIK